MAKKLKKAKKAEQIQVSKKVGNLGLIVKNAQGLQNQGFFDVANKSGLKVFVLGELTEYVENVHSVSENPEIAINEIKAICSEQGDVDCLLINSEFDKEKFDHINKWYHHHKQKSDALYFVEKLPNGFLQKLLLVIINLLYGLNLKGTAIPYTLINSKALNAFDLYDYPSGDYNYISQLRGNHPEAAEVLLTDAQSEIKFSDIVSIKLAYFKKLFFEKFLLPIKQIKQDKSGVSGLKNGNHGLYNLAYHLILFLAFIIIPLLSFDYGITWDEPVLVEYADDIIKYYSSGGENKEVFDMKKHARNATMHYSASFDVMAAVLAKVSPFGIYETRHLLNALMGVLAIMFTARIGKELGSWRIGLIAALFMILSPRYFGHSMNNPKDIPFLLGYAASLLYMIRFFKQLPAPSPATLLWLTVSMAFMISVKIGGLIVIGLFGVFSGAYWLYEGISQSWKKATGHLPKYVLYLVVIIFFSYFLGIWFWPFGYEKPFENPIISLTEFTNFRFLITYELFEGERINMDSPPWYYTFKWIGISVPLFVLAGFVLSLLPTLFKKGTSQKGILLMMFFGFFFPIIYTIIQNSTLYSGWRHLMFVYVPMIVLAAAGWNYLINLDKKWMPVAATVMVVGLFIKPAYWMVKNHPNEYVYFNEFVGGINGAYKHYETEYWCNSMKQATEWLIENGNLSEEEKTRVAANFEINSAQYYANKYPERVQILWTRENEKYKEKWDYAFFGTRGMPQALIEASFPPKGTIHMIKADTVPLLAIVKREHDYIAEAFDLRDAGKRQEALEMAEKAVEFDPQNVEGQRIKGMLQIDLNINDDAIKTLSKVIQLNPDDFVAYTLAGIAYNRKKDYEAAIRLFNKSIELKVNNSSGYLNRGRSYMALKKYNLALENFEEAAKYDNGRNPRIFVEASIALLQQGLDNPQIKNNRFQLAIRNMHRALEMNPNQRDVYQNLVYAYKEIGDEANAMKYMNILEGK